MATTKLMFVFGTRPEAIKLAPVILKTHEWNHRFDTVIVVTAQHREMLDDVLSAFEIHPDEDLNIMAPGQSLFHITSEVFNDMELVLERYAPDVIVVQGDTTTTYAAAVAGFYARKKVAHIEAGLRTGNKWVPFPEEINRKIASTVADYHFAPTEKAKQNLIREGYDEKTIFVTGNTIIDSLFLMVKKLKNAPCPIPWFEEILQNYNRMVLITGHRRESFGEPFRQICDAFKALAMHYPDVCFVYPVHLNPNVQQPVHGILDGIDNFHLLEPLPYPDFVWFMQQSYIIITDSGGIQEEAPALGKPVLVTRRVTERPEAVDSGAVHLVGDDKEKIIQYTRRLLDDPAFYKSTAQGISPYGDGKASERILRILSK